MSAVRDRTPSVDEIALVLRMAASAIATEGWSRPLPGEDEIVVAIDGHLTLVGALHRVTGISVDGWAALADPRLHAVWDALVLSLAEQLGEWSQPRTGLAQIDRVLRYERSAISCAEDVEVMLRSAAVLALRGKPSIECPVCTIDPWRSDDCLCCSGAGVLELHPDRWSRIHLRVVR